MTRSNRSNRAPLTLVEAGFEEFFSVIYASVWTTGCTALVIQRDFPL